MTSQLIVGIGQVAFIGPIDTVPKHRCLVPVIGVGLDQSFELTTPAASYRTGLLRVAPRVDRSVNAFGSRLAVIPVDPGTRFSEGGDLRQTLLALRNLADGFDEEHWRRLICALGIVPGTPQMPPAIRRVCELIATNLEQNLTATDLAKEISLSVSRLEHLFVEVLGVPLRSYRTWHRMRLVAQSLAKNQSLTNAAHVAGFHDSAHLSNSFSRMFGLPPSAIFNADLQIHLPATRSLKA